MNRRSFLSRCSSVLSLADKPKPKISRSARSIRRHPSSPRAIVIHETRSLRLLWQLCPPQFARTNSHLARSAGYRRADYAKRSSVTITIRWKCSEGLAGFARAGIASPPPLPSASAEASDVAGGDFRFGTASASFSVLASLPLCLSVCLSVSLSLLAEIQKIRGNRKLRLASESITRYLSNARPTRGRCRSKRFVRCGDFLADL